jgi:hypothetical protein
MTKIGRLAFRVEGKAWNAYYAMPDTMEGAVPLGSIRLAAVTNHPERKQAFMDLMKGIVSEVLKEECSLAPAWKIRAAPETKRSGSTGP